MKKITFSALAAVAFVVGPSFAQQPAGPPVGPDWSKIEVKTTDLGNRTYMHNTLCHYETRAEHLACPVEHRIPTPRLLVDKSARRLGAIKQHIGGEIPSDLVGNGLWRLADRVDHRIGEPGERHSARVDHIGLRIPFRRQGLRERRLRRSEHDGGGP